MQPFQFIIQNIKYREEEERRKEIGRRRVLRLCEEGDDEKSAGDG